MCFSLQIDAGVEIQPNASGTPGSSGYYVMNNTATMDELIVSDANATFVEVDANRTVVVVDSEGAVSETLCTTGDDCVVPPIDTVKNILFRIASVAIEYTYRFGGMLSKNISSTFKLASIVPYILVAGAILSMLVVFILK